MALQLDSYYKNRGNDMKTFSDISGIITHSSTFSKLFLLPKTSIFTDFLQRSDRTQSTRYCMSMDSKRFRIDVRKSNFFISSTHELAHGRSNSSKSPYFFHFFASEFTCISHWKNNNSSFDGKKKGLICQRNLRASFWCKIGPQNISNLSKKRWFLRRFICNVFLFVFLFTKTLTK